MAISSSNLHGEKLFQAAIDPNDDLDQKPIHLSAQNDHTHLVQLFLENRPSLVSSTTKDGNTLAHLAAKKGSVDVLKAMFAVDKVRVDPNMCLSNLMSQGSCDWGEEQIQQQFTSSLGDRGRPHRGGQDYARERGLCVWKIGE